jgi:hypothetical protein
MNADETDRKDLPRMPKLPKIAETEKNKIFETRRKVGNGGKKT